MDGNPADFIDFAVRGPSKLLQQDSSPHVEPLLGRAQNNGGCHFLSLPAELRVEIYRYLLQSRLLLNRHGRRTSGRDIMGLHSGHWGSSPLTYLMLTCRQVLDEVLSLVPKFVAMVIPLRTTLGAEFIGGKCPPHKQVPFWHVHPVVRHAETVCGRWEDDRRKGLLPSIPLDFALQNKYKWKRLKMYADMLLDYSGYCSLSSGGTSDQHFRPALRHWRENAESVDDYIRLGKTGDLEVSVIVRIRYQTRERALYRIIMEAGTVTVLVENGGAHGVTVLQQMFREIFDLR